ncbi:Putative competence-damaged inducible protein [Pseudooceanicola batsensis HTCC2597]|uniref:Putative competence-damaged inducible protein n=1 Tax=Pseudooceanicola batsensis (strain ATCC BAA-863 / DSM 15984 / KCTC 12145 / HTCC2597) TaxID=252305 RepID=A3TXL0_PSEBH|nr:CinA family protein [Pseudooceanicola batsensis]EAQ03570.1 Putative competence-damaged inducible protein [Pseudooceanicola batsensis HTCC2597]
MSVTPEALLEACRTAGVTLVTAESCTGGMVSSALIDIAGSSDVVLGGVVAYSNGIKRDVLGVREETLKAHGAVSEETAIEMATGALARLGAEVAVGITGVAGPGGSGSKPEGMVCFAVTRRGGETRAETCQFGALGRNAVRAASRDQAFEMIRGLLD